MASPSGAFAQRAALALIAALALAGCNGLGAVGMPPDARVAEVEPDQTGASAVNIASLTDVIQRNPNDSAAYNTRGAAYARIGRYQSAIDDFGHAVQIDPNFAAAYVNRGGPSGSLGYPSTDATSMGRQLFQQGALAGLPVQLVNGSILTKWAALGYESGGSGSPTGSATSFLTFRATSGSLQSFQGAMILSQTSGSLAGSTFAVTGLILSQYVALGGASGNLGAPLNDEYSTAAGVRQQNFEGGFAGYASGATSASVVVSVRSPVVTATPSLVLSGSFVHLTVGGF